MKATIEFNLPEDNCSHIIAVNALGFALTCWDMEAELRNWLKYGHKFDTPNDAISAIREKLHEILDVRGVNLDMIE